MRIAMVSPWPDGSIDTPWSGVAAYVESLAKSVGTAAEVHVVAQESMQTSRFGGDRVHVEGSWGGGLGSGLDVVRALQQLKPDVVHVQHEFGLFGGLASTASVVTLLRLVERKFPRVLGIP